MNIDQYAVFGHPISHSKSPLIHSLFAAQTGQTLQYTAHDVPAEQFQRTADHFFRNGVKGLNCTVPLKELAWQYASQLTERARAAKAVNTLAWQADGSILGDNTDGMGLVRDLVQNHDISLAGQHILILGAGGASRGIIAPILAEHPADLVIANRTLSKAQAIVNEFSHLGSIRAHTFAELAHQRFDLILNATSTSLNNELPPLPQGLLDERSYCYDLAYGEEPTTFVRWGLAHGARKCLDGLGMLVEQAAEAFYVWRGIRPDTQAVIDRLNNERSAF